MANETAAVDILAARRADYAEMLFAEGEAAAAAEVMLSALEQAPDWAIGWARLGEYQEAAGLIDQARVSWRTALALDPADHAGVALKFQLIDGLPAAVPPPAFVATLFDQYAAGFDRSLVGQLGYSAPDLLASAIARLGRPRFGRVLDLGCGTGLAGERLRPLAERLEGFDLSAGMLAKARAKGIYDRLDQVDIADLPASEGPVDLVVAADVFIYVGPLERVLSTIRALLAPDGLLAFTVETVAEGNAVVLRETRRFAHPRAYVEAALAEAGLAVVSLEAAVLRQDRGAPVDGLVVMARLTD